MRLRLFTWAAALALSALLVADAGAFCRRGRGGGGCGGAAPGWSGVGCADCGAEGGAFGWAGARTAWGWRTFQGELLLEDRASGMLYARGNDGVYRAVPGLVEIVNRPAAQGGASRAIAADRAKRGQQVYTIDPASGQPRTVGWLEPDGTFVPIGDGKD